MTADAARDEVAEIADGIEAACIMHPGRTSVAASAMRRALMPLAARLRALSREPQPDRVAALEAEVDAMAEDYQRAAREHGDCEAETAALLALVREWAEAGDAVRVARGDPWSPAVKRCIEAESALRRAAGGGA